LVGARNPGLAVEIARLVFGEAGYGVDYQAVNWARCVEDSRAGRYTGIIGAIHIDAPDFIFPATPIAFSGDGYAVKAGDHFRFKDATSLDGKVLGVIRNYNYMGVIGAYVTAHRNDPSRIEFVSGDDALAKNLAKLQAGRVDVVLDDKNVLANAIADLGLGKRVTLTSGPGTAPIYIAFSPVAPRGKDLARILDAGMARLRASGRLAAILAKYHVQDGT
jgi:polar amino acid transport system substrate-binding protein